MESSSQHFLNLLRSSRRGRFKVYLGMAAGVGKTYRMLQEAHSLLRHGVDVVVGYVETHRRVETEQMLEGLPVISRKQVFYKGRSLEELDIAAVLRRHPEVVLVDELAHSNVPGSEHEKRWQDVVKLLEAGISVISAMNIQHLESLHAQMERLTGIEITERVPDSVLRQADEVLNVDIGVEELLTRLREGKIYDPKKVGQALENFFKEEHLWQLRELALRESANLVERRVFQNASTVKRNNPEALMACIGTDAKKAKQIIRKASRLSDRLQVVQWYVLYVQTPRESADRIGLAAQRHLINNMQMATELGAQVLRVKGEDLGQTVYEVATEKKVSLLVCGLDHVKGWKKLLKQTATAAILQQVSNSDLALDIYLVNS